MSNFKNTVPPVAILYLCVRGGIDFHYIFEYLMMKLMLMECATWWTRKI